MSIMEFLSRLRSLGIKLWLEGDALRYQAAKGVMTRELLEELSRRKSEIIVFLRQANAGPDARKDPITPVSREAGSRLPLTYSQHSMWFFDQFTGGNPVFNISNAVRMSGVLDKGAVKRSLQELVKRHEALRTTFKNIEGSPVQVINSRENLELPETDLRPIPADGPDCELKRLLKQEARRVFDLEKGPLYRFCLFVLGDNEHVLSMTIHHIISDAWSNAIFIGEFFKLYEGFLKGTAEALPALPLQFADYAAWEKNHLQGETLETLAGYWRKQLANPTTLQLPADRARPKTQTYEGGFQPVVITEELAEKLRAICAREGATLFMGLLAAFQTLLHRYSGQEDIFTGTVVANRGRAEISSVVGFFMNTLVLRTGFQGDPDFQELLRRVRQMTLDAFTYQELPFDKMLEDLKPERDVSRTPLFQVMFILHNTRKVELEMPGLKMSQVEVGSGMAPFDLRLQLTETEEGIKGGFDYNTALLDPSTAARMGKHLLNLLKGIADNPGKRVSELPLLDAEERGRLLLEFNRTEAPYPEDTAIYRLFEEQAAKNPGNIAVIFEDRKLTYGELDQKAGRLAAFLRKKGVGAESVVGVLLERSLEMIIGIMAIEKAGGAYLPIDPHYPEDRIAYILEDSGTALLLTHKKFGPIPFGDHVERIFPEEEALYSEENILPPGEADPRGLAYVIYTSGSTGKPKGTLIEHGALVNRLNWMQKRYPIGRGDVLLQKTPFTFDVSVWELFWWSAQGAAVCLLKPGGEKDPGKIVNAIEKNGITVVHFVPSMLSAFLDYLKDSGEAARVAGLKQVFASGEALTPAQVRLFGEILGRNGTRLSNLYGPTEATIDVSYFDCVPGEDYDTVPIGKPIDNLRLYVVDRNLQPQPVGVPGELCIGGVGLARGYLNRPDLTAEKFVPDPFSSPITHHPSPIPPRMYRTGDLARWREDGNIEYLGRMDFQVKLRGFRIELGEIERVLSGHPAVRECIVNAWEKQPGDLHLVGYVVCGKDETAEPGELQEFLGKALPEYMVPRMYVFLDAIPLSPNGKADRKALPKPVPVKSADYVAPRDEIEKILADIWKEELGVENIGVHDNFFEAGGHSLLLTRVHSRLKRQFDKDFSLIELFTYSTIATLAKYISGGQAQPAFLKNEDRLQKQKEAKQRRKQMHGRG